jgi:AcrR family transcriptional regulator
MARRNELFSPRGQILLGAAAAFGARGHAGASVEHILAESGVSRRTFYRFFRSKEDVFEQLFESAAIMFIQAIRTAASAGGSPEEMLSRCIDAYLDLPTTAGPLFHVFQVEANRPGSSLFARRERVIEELVTMLDTGYRAVHGGRAADPLVLRGLIAALERIATATTDTRAAKAAMMHILKATLS